MQIRYIDQFYSHRLDRSENKLLWKIRLGDTSGKSEISYPSVELPLVVVKAFKVIPRVKFYDTKKIIRKLLVILFRKNMISYSPSHLQTPLEAKLYDSQKVSLDD